MPKAPGWRNTLVSILYIANDICLLVYDLPMSLREIGASA